MEPYPAFTAGTVRGYGNGKMIGIPTINLSMGNVPKDLPEGVYACRASIGQNEPAPATMHLGPRPVFGQESSCEIHFLDAKDIPFPETVTVYPIQWLRDIRNFSSKEDLVRQILADNDEARGILAIS
ncbi:riboflavin kinase [Candidatus Peregrinibacteria bacterium]|nr:riboflavin kinase [Candidatus Peregrinibacteria bacterium]